MTREFTLSEAIDNAVDNEALGLVGEAKLGAAQAVYDKADIYADLYGYSVVRFRAALLKAYPGCIGITLKR
jgi:hypothetical protein